jgi:succinylarginine dihydrolase
MTHGRQELQLDGLVGPTHHFGGLSRGNLASMTHSGWQSHPRQAARQGLAKMRQVLALNVPQAILPPLERPDLDFLRQVGFSGDSTAVLQQAAACEPYLLSLAMSSAFMWTANTATVVPSCDSTDGRCHLVVANLAATPHRVMEAQPRAAMLRRLFSNPDKVVVHDPLPVSAAVSDEGAANHCRFSYPGMPTGHHLFVYGRSNRTPHADLPSCFPARQSDAGSRAVARLGCLPEHRRVLARQHPQAIDAGAFHNDVVMVVDENRILLHEHCLVDQQQVLQVLRRHVPDLHVYQVAEDELSMSQVVASYLFNSQLLSTPLGRVLLAPMQSRNGAAYKVIQRLLAEGFIDQVTFHNLDQSMAGGGGPACLRLRLSLTQDELQTLVPGVRLDQDKLQRLETWVDQHYRDRLTPSDLADPQLMRETQTALDRLTQILEIGSLYRFQRVPT